MTKVTKAEAETLSGLAHQENALDDPQTYYGTLAERMDKLTIAVQDYHRDLSEIKTLEQVLQAIHVPGDEPPRVVRRRDEIAIRRAIATLVSGQPRARDDESEQILLDCLAEMISMRQINYDLMQQMTTGYQNGLAAIRRMTER